MKKNYYIAASALLALMIVAAIYLGERRYKILSRNLYTQALEDAKNNPKDPVIDKDNPQKDPDEIDDQTEEEEYEEIEGISFLIIEKQMKSTAKVNVRSGPGTSFSVLGSLSANEEVTVTAIGENNWARISFEGQEGFCNADYLEEQQ